MNIKKITVAALAATTTATLTAAVPEVSDSTMTQDTRRLVTITYTLSAAPAVVTLDVQTNANTSAAADDPGWTSIGGAAVSNAKGDVWKQVATGNHTITWRPDLSWPDHKIADGGARAVVTAWALDNTPDYMVVDISSAAQPNTQKYYPAADFLPGGLLGKDEYRTTSIVMRKIMAKDVTWTMGSTPLETQRTQGREDTHTATLTNNCYIGVFPVTQAQWDLIQINRLAPSYFNNAADRAMRPVEGVCYSEIRTNDGTSADANPTYNWPHGPNPSSFLGRLSKKTGIDFDIPGEAQWEFAARAGNGDTKWGDGSGVMNTASTEPDENLDLLGRYKLNGGYVDGSTAPAQSCGAANGTAIVGSYAPNDWGLYDMHGNVLELCLDWLDGNIRNINGSVNIKPATPSTAFDGTTGTYRVARGGCWNSPAGDCRSACRTMVREWTRTNIGFRLVCTAGLQ